MRSARRPPHRPTSAEIERSNAFLAAVLGPKEVAHLDEEAIDRTHNRPPEPIKTEEAFEYKGRREVEAADQPVERARERVEQEIANTNDWAAQVKIEDEHGAADLVDRLDQLGRLWKLCDGQRAAEKLPHDEASAAVQNKWRPLLDKLALCKAALKPLETAWHKLQQKRIDDEREVRRRAAEEAQRKADQLAEQAKANSANVVTNMANAMEAAQEANRKRQEAAAVPMRAQTRGNLGGRTHSLRTEWKADLVEIKEAFEHYKGRREVKELLQTLAKADARNPRIWVNPEVRRIPGFYVYKEQV